MSCFAEDGRSGTFVIGDERFPASLLDLPCVVESYKTYDDCALVKTADIGQVYHLLTLSLYSWKTFISKLLLRWLFDFVRWLWLEKQVILLQMWWSTDMGSLLLWGMLESEDFAGSQTSMYLWSNYFQNYVVETKIARNIFAVWDLTRAALFSFSPYCLYWLCLYYLVQPELVQRVEKDLLNIMAGGTVDNADILQYYA